MKIISAGILSLLIVTSGAQASSYNGPGDRSGPACTSEVEDTILNFFFTKTGHFNTALCVQADIGAALISQLPFDVAKTIGTSLKSLIPVACQFARFITRQEVAGAVGWITGCHPPTDSNHPGAGAGAGGGGAGSEMMNRCWQEKPATSEVIQNERKTIEYGMNPVFPQMGNALPSILDASMKKKFDYYATVSKNCDELVSRIIVYEEVAETTEKDLQALFSRIGFIGDVDGTNVLGTFHLSEENNLPICKYDPMNPDYFTGCIERRNAELQRIENLEAEEHRSIDQCAQDNFRQWDTIHVQIDRLPRIWQHTVANAEANIAYSAKSCDEVLSQTAEFTESWTPLYQKTSILFPDPNS